MRRLTVIVGIVHLLILSAAAQDMRIVNIRVGQGDSTLIQGPQDAGGNRVNVLFDAGDIPDLDGGNILRAVLRRYDVNRLDAVIISHDDADHVGGIAFGGVHGKSFILGFNDSPGCSGDDDGDGAADWIGARQFFEPDPEELGLCDDMRVGQWIDYGEALMRSTQAIEKYNAIANAMGERITINNQETVDTFSLDLGGGAVMTAYAANGYVRGRGARVKNVDRPNERSLSFLVTYGDFDFLISGDLIGRKSGSENAQVEEAVAEAILRDGRIVDVLHVNHHGADNGSASVFIDALEPNIAIISAGNGNDHKHPRNGALKRLYDGNVYRTILTSFGNSRDRISNEVRSRIAVYQNDVVITTDGDSYEISTRRAFRADKNCVRDPSTCSRGLR
ncbi:MAG: MBL fold metallo-hydrolase [Henriciella sp.]|uniref:ComEC/Rec2 family competence protein n=1 Tax=Henriciella sp. TaxID=1968823 RepID=UPI003C71947A